ncbi:MAG: dockerin type I domain-containing protein [Planctomycetota bacterium]
MLTFSNNRLLAALLIPAASVAFAAQGQTTLFQEDFDGSFNAGDSSGNFANPNRIFTPDNNSNTGFSGLPSPIFDPGGSGTGRFFDYGGIGQGHSATNGLPFEAMDDSAGSFPPDVQGLIESTKTDNYFIMSDTVNGANGSGVIQIGWTNIDISGYENLQLSVDMAAIGDFEGSDSATFLYQIDGGAATPFLNAGLTNAEDNADTLYTIEMESGTVADRYFTPFFEQDEFDVLIANGPGDYDLDNDDNDNDITTGTLETTLAYHPDDNGGPDDDGIANNGRIKELTFDEPALDPMDVTVGTTEAYNVTNSFGNFDQQEFEAYSDPLRANGSVTGVTQLDDEYQTITSDIADTGSTLTLIFSGTLNGSGEIFSFDDVLLTGDLIAMALEGDYNGDGVVDGADYTFWANRFGGTTADDLLADGNGDGVVDGADYTFWANRFGNTASLTLAEVAELYSPTAVPEPAALAMLAAAGLIAGTRRRRSS